MMPIRTGNNGKTQGVKANNNPERKNPPMVNNGEATVGNSGLVSKFSANPEYGIMLINISNGKRLQ